MPQATKNMTYPQILWDCGTAYDFFISLEVLHNPDKFELRPAWTAGMRARLSPEDRKTLDQIQALLTKTANFEFLYHLPEPKDGNAVLWALSRLTPQERLATMTQGLACCYPEAIQILATIAQRQSWDESDQERLKAAFAIYSEKKLFSSQDLSNILDWWAHPEESGERYLQALRAYYEGFFAEEEKRIWPILKEALERAQALAEQLALPDLMEELTQGVRLDDAEWEGSTEIVLVPSFWGTPFLYEGEISATCWLYVFGARPTNMSLIPGETAPEGMIKMLKALSDPTRLNILQYLAQEPHSPAQLAKRLRLRAPTITHHLRTLRLARLVRVVVQEETHTVLYAARFNAVNDLCAALQSFLKKEEGVKEQK